MRACGCRERHIHMFTPSTTTVIKHERRQTAQEFNGLKLKIKQSRIYLFNLAFQHVKVQHFPAVLPVAKQVNCRFSLFNCVSYFIQQFEDFGLMLLKCVTWSALDFIIHLESFLLHLYFLYHCISILT